MRSKFEKMYYRNNWKLPKYCHLGSRTLFGLSIQYFSNTEYEYDISVFGFVFRFWFKKVDCK
jgi:hypothetical protein